MTDYYLENPPLQPKKEIADYVESNGILVPRRFESLEEARQFNGEVIARSEITEEYDKLSGILPSSKLSIHKGFEKEKNLWEQILEKEGLWKAYCWILGIDEDTFRDRISFSYWEKLPCYNRTIIADSAIKGLYHITTRAKNFENYLIFDEHALFEEGQVKQYIIPLPKTLYDNIETLIEFYEQIRNLDRFESLHCPLLEVQTVVEEMHVLYYFLQYHRTRDFVPADFSISNIPDDAVEAEWVRGITGKKGIRYKTAVAYAADCTDSEWKDKWTIREEDACMALPFTACSQVFLEIMASKWKAFVRDYITENRFDINYEFAGMIHNHISRSLFYKPDVSFMASDSHIEKLFPAKEKEHLEKKAAETGKDQYIDIHIVSDGRKAYIKRVK